MTVVCVGNEKIVETITIDIDEGYSSPISSDITQSSGIRRFYVLVLIGSLRRGVIRPGGQ
jgi:hypothetical protein